eukprot:gene20149-26161_t
MTSIIGTDGYKDPEYERTGRASKASDIYSWTMTALQIFLAPDKRNLRWTDKEFIDNTINKFNLPEGGVKLTLENIFQKGSEIKNKRWPVELLLATLENKIKVVPSEEVKVLGNLDNEIETTDKAFVSLDNEVFTVNKVLVNVDRENVTESKNSLVSYGEDVVTQNKVLVNVDRKADTDNKVNLVKEIVTADDALVSHGEDVTKNKLLVNIDRDVATVDKELLYLDNVIGDKALFNLEKEIIREDEIFSFDKEVLTEIEVLVNLDKEIKLEINKSADNIANDKIIALTKESSTSSIGFGDIDSSRTNEEDNSLKILNIDEDITVFEALEKGNIDVVKFFIDKDKSLLYSQNQV